MEMLFIFLAPTNKNTIRVLLVSLNMKIYFIYIDIRFYRNARLHCRCSYVHDKYFVSTYCIWLQFRRSTDFYCVHEKAMMFCKDNIRFFFFFSSANWWWQQRLCISDNIYCQNFAKKFSVCWFTGALSLNNNLLAFLLFSRIDEIGYDYEVRNNT